MSDDAMLTWDSAPERRGWSKAGPNLRFQIPARVLEVFQYRMRGSYQGPNSVGD